MVVILHGGFIAITLNHKLIWVSSHSASTDNIRLWNVAEAGEPDAYGKMKSGVQFKIIPGHHGGYVSQMCKYSGSIVASPFLTPSRSG